MADITVIPGIADLRRHTRGAPHVCVAVLDGPVDRDHPGFAGADGTSLAALASGRATSGGMSRHGTHLASVLFGRPDGPVPGLAPGRRGLIVPSFAEEEGHRSQRDRARALDPAVEAGAQVSNVSGGPKVPTSEAEDLLARAIRHARDRNVLIVAAAGNDGCACLHVPAAVAFSAVGCLDPFSLFGGPIMITPSRMSAPTPKSTPWPTPRRPAQAAPVRRESVPAGGDEPRGLGGMGGITPGHECECQRNPAECESQRNPPNPNPFAGSDDV